MIKRSLIKTLSVVGICFVLISQNVLAQVEDPSFSEEMTEEYEEEVLPEDPGSFRLGNKEQGLQTKAVSQVTYNTFLQPAKYSTYTIQKGVDVSYYNNSNGTIDWNRVKAQGVDFAIIRVGYRGYGTTGSLNEDPKYQINIEGALKAGLSVGVYMFSQAITTTEAEKEAEFVLSRIKNYSITLPIVMDYEFASDSNGMKGRLWDAKLSKTAATNISNAFCAKVKEAGYTPMIYADKNYLTNYLNAENLTGSVWLAHYTGGPASNYTGVYEYWQCASNGTVPGLTGNVDINFRYIKPGNNTGTQTPPAAGSTIGTANTTTSSSGVTTMKSTIAKTNGTSINVRKDAGTSYAKIATLDINQSVTITGTKNDWYQVIVSVSGKNKTGFIKKTYLTIINQPTIKSAAAKSKSKVKLAWGKVSGANGYVIQRSSGGSYKTIKTIKKGSTVSFSNTGLKSKKTYKYKIKAYKTVNGKKIYSNYSKVKSVKTK